MVVLMESGPFSLPTGLSKMQSGSNRGDMTLARSVFQMMLSNENGKISERGCPKTPTHTMHTTDMGVLTFDSILTQIVIKVQGANHNTRYLGTQLSTHYSSKRISI